jgi:hypothetical protein
LEGGGAGEIPAPTVKVWMGEVFWLYVLCLQALPFRKTKGGMPMDPQHYMRIALELARTAQGQTSLNPSVNGTGIGLLRAAGIKVITSTLQKEAEQLKQAFFHFIRYGTPYVTLKAAATLDGRLSTQHGDSKWIT